MGGLVGYGSSSEEDEPSKTEARSTTISKSNEKLSGPASNANGKNGTVEAASLPESGGEEHMRTEDGCVKPLIGPTMPDRMDDHQEQGPSSAALESMSEREAVRYLTQASHPMTSIPPSPPDSPDPTLNAKFKRFLDLKAQGVHFNNDLAIKSTFRNPSLLSMMMVRAGLDGNDQYRTSLPLEVWDPSSFPPSAYKEELLRSQQTLRESELSTKRNLSASGKRTIEFTSGGTSGSTSRDSTPGMANKRKRP
ncbi:uncharacterized protein Z518_10479 [Rhinocladiella mackenziei CBS 650.93]|uniref:HCNGP-like protein n=1 Tax=Rhinocladiella mackenziei CBS 650.93 TaxID=1442369 RepID=A0A0D2IUD6_9EURO|nr:uncharacterized protein Z518_10479 [Rhinocladiella mackenziei CBS 650.93]KIX00340.1 hypothetical protein Z518_10479 [Rhinocladiella mackenziei CBS 650.93]